MNSGITLAEQTAVSLQNITIIDYHRQPMPDPLDEELRGIVAAFQQLPADEREAFIGALPHQARKMFGIYGHRAATIAVRQEEPAWLRSGLIGTVIANDTIANDGMDDERNIVTALAVPQHCAIKLKMNLAALFAETAVYAHPPLSDSIINASRTPLSLRTFGWRELKTAAGVKYKFGMG